MANEWKPLGGGGSGGTSDYDALSNRPKVNGYTLSGNKTSANLNLIDKSTTATDSFNNAKAASIDNTAGAITISTSTTDSTGTALNGSIMADGGVFSITADGGAVIVTNNTQTYASIDTGGISLIDYGSTSDSTTGDQIESHSEIISLASSSGIKLDQMDEDFTTTPSVQNTATLQLHDGQVTIDQSKTYAQRSSNSIVTKYDLQQNGGGGSTTYQVLESFLKYESGQWKSTIKIKGDTSATVWYYMNTSTEGWVKVVGTYDSTTTMTTYTNNVTSTAPTAQGYLSTENIDMSSTWGFDYTKFIAYVDSIGGPSSGLVEISGGGTGESTRFAAYKALSEIVGGAGAYTLRVPGVFDTSTAARRKEWHFAIWIGARRTSSFTNYDACHAILTFSRNVGSSDGNQATKLTLTEFDVPFGNTLKWCKDGNDLCLTFNTGKKSALLLSSSTNAVNLIANMVWQQGAMTGQDIVNGAMQTTDGSNLPVTGQVVVLANLTNVITQPILDDSFAQQGRVYYFNPLATHTVTSPTGTMAQPFKTWAQVESTIGTETDIVLYLKNTDSEDITITDKTRWTLAGGLATKDGGRVNVNSLTTAGASHGCYFIGLVCNTTLTDSSSGNNYYRYCTIKQATTTSGSGYVQFELCGFEGNFGADSATTDPTATDIDFIGCSFESSSKVTVDNATVILTNCRNVSLINNLGIAYSVGATNFVPAAGDTYAITANSGAQGTLLYDGQCTQSTGGLAPIKINGGVYTTGKLSYEKSASDFTGAGSELPTGLNAGQVQDLQTFTNISPASPKTQSIINKAIDDKFTNIASQYVSQASGTSPTYSYINNTSGIVQVNAQTKVQLAKYAANGQDIESALVLDGGEIIANQTTAFASRTNTSLLTKGDALSWLMPSTSSPNGSGHYVNSDTQQQIYTQNGSHLSRFQTFADGSNTPTTQITARQSMSETNLTVTPTGVTLSRPSGYTLVDNSIITKADLATVAGSISNITTV